MTANILPDGTEISKFVDILMNPPRIAELRIPNVPRRGTVSGTPLIQEHQLTHGDLVLFSSDGIQERFYRDIERDLLTLDAKQITQHMMKNFSKQYDDSSCLAFIY